jgi:hypothetical protein
MVSSFLSESSNLGMLRSSVSSRRIRINVPDSERHSGGCGVDHFRVFASARMPGPEGRVLSALSSVA